jgi:hypothetical protein
VTTGVLLRPLRRLALRRRIAARQRRGNGAREEHRRPARQGAGHCGLFPGVEVTLASALAVFEIAPLVTVASTW